MDLPGLAALLTPEGWALLESLPPYQETDAISIGERLRNQGHPPELVSAALTQSRLRSVARQKFGPFAEGMLFTQSGLEQATRFSVAARHAHRFTSAEIDRVADLGCGIGADSMALATFDRTVLAVDNDELTAAVATMNLRHWPEAIVRHEDATSTDLSGFGGVFCDPARRTASGRRVLDPRRASPPLSFVLDVASRVPAVGMKTAPGIDHDLIPVGVEAQWISVGGEVVEAGLWFGILAREPIRRCALLLPADSATQDSAEAVEVTDIDMPQPETGDLGHILYEPDPAVIRAGLVGQVAAAVHGRLLDRSIAYVTSDTVHRTPLATAYAVEEIFPFQLKRLRTWLRDHNIGQVTIKKRGTAVDPDQLRRQLHLAGDQETTIVLTRIRGRQSVLVVRPLR